MTEQELLVKLGFAAITIEALNAEVKSLKEELVREKAFKEDLRYQLNVYKGRLSTPTWAGDLPGLNQT